MLKYIWMIVQTQRTKYPQRKNAQWALERFRQKLAEQMAEDYVPFEFVPEAEEIKETGEGCAYGERDGLAIGC